MCCISSSERLHFCCDKRLFMICCRAPASGRGMYNLFTNRRLAASSISCGLTAENKLISTTWQPHLKTESDRLVGVMFWPGLHSLLSRLFCALPVRRITHMACLQIFRGSHSKCRGVGRGDGLMFARLRQLCLLSLSHTV